VTEPEKRERTPREEIIVSTIQLLSMLTIAIAAPMIERLMSDPDVGYRIRWHVKHLHRRFEYRMHELNMGIETAIGIWQIEETLRRNWKESAHDDHTA
jgi:hypothetical protein